MKGTPNYIPSGRSVTTFVAVAAVMALADALLLAWWIGSAWGMAVAVGAMVGLLLFVAWALRHYGSSRPRR